VPERPGVKRLKELQRRLAAERLDCFVVTHLPNIFYLCGFTGSAGALVVNSAGATLLTDSRYTIQASQEACGVAVRIVGGPLDEAITAETRGRRRTRVGFEPAHLTVEQHARLVGAAGKTVEWVGLPGAVEKLRMVKDPEEVQRMRASARLISEVFEELVSLMKPGVRERDLAAEADFRMRRKGASGPAFDTIVASGKRAALPHAHPSSKPLGKNELVVFDLGAILAGYCSDLTRTVFLGRSQTRVRRWYRAVLEAQEAARETLRPGVAAGSVDAAARRILKRYGLDRRFTHNTGHGLGIEVHEGPRLGRNEKARITTGHVVTLEPGVYVEGVGGIRVEDDVLVLAKGTEVLTTVNREFLEL
jgi:Xaa-Pro aminopeptidase